jgi:hypothetical protein
MGGHVPLSKRRDLKPPVYLHLAPAARFPRLVVRPGEGDREHLYGPFRNRPAAQSAIEALHALFRCVPATVFEPAGSGRRPRLRVGVRPAPHRACSASAKTITAPSRARAAVLGAGARQAPELAAALPSWVTAAEGVGSSWIDWRDGRAVSVLAGPCSKAMASTTLEGLDRRSRPCAGRRLPAARRHAVAAAGSTASGRERI